jgi:signal transduction histidine kinase/CheY-like chemotaxis protein
MRLLAWFRRRLGLKLISAMLLLLGVVWTTSIVHTIESERKALSEQIDAQGASLCKAASVFCVEPLLVEDYPVLAAYVGKLVAEREDVVCMQVVRADGRVVSIAPSDVPQPPGGDHIQVYEAPIRVAGKDSSPLGRVILTLSTRSSQAFVEERLRALAFESAGAFLALALLLALLLKRGVSDPVGRLVLQAESLGRGDLESPIGLRSSDELGRLALTLEQVRRNLKASHDEVRAQNQKLREISQKKGEFLANLSHEIRSPLTAILGFADLLQRPAENDVTKQRHIEIIRRSSAHLRQVVSDVLDLSKIEAGKARIERVPCSPFQILVEVESLLRPRAVEKGLFLDLEFDGPIPEKIQSESTRLRQILINLVSNAIKFTERGGVTVTTGLARVAEKETPQLCFRVRDTGIGMTPHEMTTVFEPFAQVAPAGPGGSSGTGLGLTIARELAKRLGGDVQVESESDKGSRFTATVEIGPLNGVRMLDPGEFAPPRSSESPRAGPSAECRLEGRVLVAEDEPDTQRLITTIFEDAGAEVALAGSGRAALDVAMQALRSGRPFDLILMDIRMPELDGCQAARLMRQQGLSGPIIAVSAHAMASDRAKCLEAGCDDFLSKPIDQAQLLAIAADYVKRDKRASSNVGLAP